MRELLDEPIGIKDRYGEEKRSDDAATQCIDNDSQLDGGALRARNDDKLIKFNHVCFQYQDKTPVLNDVSFEVEQGQKIAIIGKTGSGKSTVIKLLTRLYELDQGSIEINGRNIKEIPQLELREKIAVIHQDTYIFAGNLESNIKLGRDEAKLDMQLAKRFLDLAPGLRKERDLLNLSNVSSGEEQVINFARALVARPDILVLDEATAKIDLETEKAIYELLNEYIQGKTLITIAHRLETIKSADLVLELKNGSLLKQ